MDMPLPVWNVRAEIRYADCMPEAPCFKVDHGADRNNDQGTEHHDRQDDDRGDDSPRSPRLTPSTGSLRLTGNDASVE
jgi:hypothetical protein